MDQETVEKLARVVDDAAMESTPITMLTAEHEGLTIEDAYRIQRASMRRRFGRGETLVGMKMGLTSRAKMEQMGVHNPIYGHLTSSMKLTSGGSFKKENYCHPRVEPEIAFIMGRDISGQVTSQEALSAVSGVCAALEIIDSRYKDFKFTLNDVVADNASSTLFVLGEKIATPDLDVSNLGMVMSVDGEVRETGSSAAILEHPLRSLAALICMLDSVSEGLHAGQIVLAGGATQAIACTPGSHVSLEVESLGSVEFFVE